MDSMDYAITFGHVQKILTSVAYNIKPGPHAYNNIIIINTLKTAVETELRDFGDSEQIKLNFIYIP